MTFGRRCWKAHSTLAQLHLLQKDCLAVVSCVLFALNLRWLVFVTLQAASQNPRMDQVSPVSLLEQELQEQLKLKVPVLLWRIRWSVLGAALLVVLGAQQLLWTSPISAPAGWWQVPAPAEPPHLWGDAARGNGPWIAREVETGHPDWGAVCKKEQDEGGWVEIAINVECSCTAGIVGLENEREGHESQEAAEKKKIRNYTE